MLWVFAGVCGASTGFPAPPPRAYWPTEGWRRSTPEAQGLDSSALAKAVDFVREFNDGGRKRDVHGYYSSKHADAFLVVRGGYLVSENYWGRTNATSLHDIASGTKSVGSIALAHAVHAGHFDPNTSLATYFHSLKPLNPQAAATPLMLKHIVSMAGGCNATYWQGRDGRPNLLTREYVVGLRQGPPGAPESIAEHGILKRPGSDFVYSFANPALATGVLRQATGMSYAAYSATHIFPVLGIRRSEWRWLGDREGDSQADGGSFHTARNYAKLAYLMLNGGQWGVNGTVQQLIDPAWVAGAAMPSPTDWGPCPYYSHFFWRKPLGTAAAPVPTDAFYAFGGGGQYAVVVPSLDLIVVSLFGGTLASFKPPPDVDTYLGHEYFPTPTDMFLNYGHTGVQGDGGGFGIRGAGWNFTYHEPQPQIKTKSPPSTTAVNGDECDGWKVQPREPDLLSGMMRLVVAAVKKSDVTFV